MKVSHDGPSYRLRAARAKAVHADMKAFDAAYDRLINAYERLHTTRGGNTTGIRECQEADFAMSTLLKLPTPSQK